MKIDLRFLGMWIGIGVVLLLMAILVNKGRQARAQKASEVSDAQVEVLDASIPVAVDAAMDAVEVQDKPKVEVTPEPPPPFDLKQAQKLYGDKVVDINTILGKFEGFHYSNAEITKKKGSLYPYRVVWRPQSKPQDFPSFDCGFFPSTKTDFLVSYCKGGDIPVDKGRVLMPLLFLRNENGLFMKCGDYKITSLKRMN